MNRFLVVSPRDNVGTALEPLARGDTIVVDGATIRVAESVPRGHKMALREIPMGAEVVKYGSPIGTASTAIAAGTHVHTHNVASARGRGDLAPAARPDDARLAEPPDADADQLSAERRR
jgi:altronate hydrolase